MPAVEGGIMPPMSDASAALGNILVTRDQIENRVTEIGKSESVAIAD